MPAPAGSRPRPDANPAWHHWLLAVAAALLLWLAPVPAALAVSAGDLPELPTGEHVLDTASVLSRAARSELEIRLAAFEEAHIDARLVTLNRLDYGLSLPQVGRELIDRWKQAASPDPLLLLLIDSQTNTAAVVVDPALNGQLPRDLLTSTARSTMAAPLRDGARYRQASIEALDRLALVLQGGEDPGDAAEAEVVSLPSNVPSREETASSNAFTWVIVLLVVGTLVPMLTWWVFSR
ncbi:photosystem II repair protein Psb32 [Synechococcus sp. CS-1328]|uniref:photosystem II repair protein Psb32 n=1 Tax=Synechococcus sp. CS-1328 TaxID=2847976 RepID=UPI00223B0188